MLLTTGRCRRTGRFVLLGLLGILAAGGCPLPTSITNDTNGTFATAKPISLDDSDQAEFTAEITDSEDTDVFDLGILSPGDRLFVDIQTTQGNLDSLAAVFDAREYMQAFNDDREPDGSNLNPLIDITIHGPQGDYFLGVAPYPGSGSTGTYRVTVRVTRGVGLLDPEPQIVYLNWQGGTGIAVENVGVFNIDPFDAADVGFPGQTEPLKDGIQNYIAAAYEGFNLILLDTDDDPLPSDPHSTVYFGGFNRSAFAIAEQIDTQNADMTDDAIVFSDGFLNAFSITPSFSQMVTAIGNTAAHEIGHLLGLVHTKDCNGLMDSTCGNDALLGVQVFKLSPIDKSVFPIGYQDAVELIAWAIGVSGA